MIDYKDAKAVLEACEKTKDDIWLQHEGHYFIALSLTALPYWVQRAQELEQIWDEFICNEEEHQEKICVAECHDRKHGYCYDTQKCEKMEAENTELRAVKRAAEELILFNDQVGLDIKDDGADNCGRRTYDLLIRKLQTLAAAKAGEPHA